jgi:hypothetical protein
MTGHCQATERETERDGNGHICAVINVAVVAQKPPVSAL